MQSAGVKQSSNVLIFDAFNWTPHFAEPLRVPFTTSFTWWRH